MIGLDGLMSEEAGEFAGLTQAEAEKRIVAQLEERGLIEKREPFRHSVGHCDRSGTGSSRSSSSSGGWRWRSS